ncbi:uncharacterized protein PRCAT00000183001 [Priceomyces carsonii]|uniref:uncharacterized protein n=1 Tax=Priceomyces carsonii TaxID=28549 RepID=UPI002EDA3AC7|nr:unnamed protein product [Priceomyces carsonii]
MTYSYPYLGIPQQYVSQPFYPQFYGQQGSDEQLNGSRSIDPQPTSFDQYAQFQGDQPFSFNADGNSGLLSDYYGEDILLMNDDNSQLQNPNNMGFLNPNQLQFSSGMSHNIQQGNSAGIPSMPNPPANPLHEILYNQNNSGGNASAAPSRTVYLGNIPSDIEPNELLDYVRSGILENVKILPSKNCAFISFIDHQSALLFHSDCILKKLNIKGHDIRIGWGKNTSILPAVMESIQRDGATRNVYLGNLNNPTNGEMITEQELIDDLSAYGIIDCIKIIPEKGIAFIHFLSILSAIRCVANLPLKEKYLDKKCFYGKDRCAFITKTQQHNAAQYLGLAPGMEHIVTAADREFISSALVQQSAAAAQIATQAGGANNLGNRTVYLGNLHQDSSVEEICNVVRGGLLQSIRYLKERHACFITFIDPIAAAQFFAMCQLHGLTIHNRRIKVGWGKHSGPLSNALSLAVSNGASRNIYIGNISDFDFYNPAKLRDDFSKFGDIEQINYLEEKNCAFINFVNIANAIKAIDGIKSFNDYKNLKINFGKDRCGNLPRQFQTQLTVNQLNNIDNMSNQSFSDNEFMNDEHHQTQNHAQQPIADEI